MGIRYIEESRSFVLNTPTTTYVMSIVDQEGFVGHTYYGKTISDEDVRYLLRIEDGPRVPSQEARERGSFMDCFPSEFPGNGVGDYREGMVEVRDARGHNAVQLFYRGYEIYAGKKKLEGLPATFGTEQEVTTLELQLEDPVLGLKAVASYSVFEDLDVIAKSIRYENASKEDITLTKVLSSCVDMDAEDYEVLTLHGTWARERHMDQRPMGYGRTNVGSFRGESSHQEHPFLALVSAKATQETGSVYGFHFVYSGNFIAQAEKSQFDFVRVLMGIHPQNFAFLLQPGETFQAPEVICVYSGEGLGHMTRTYHDLYRNHLIRSPYKDKERPILLNNWEATYFNFNTEKLLDIAREAKKDGIEMLVMDDGWFGRRNDDNSSLGDWTVNEEKLPGGLKHLVEEVNRIGLKFGIWMEPEMISPDSDLYRTHPDWAIAVPDRTPCRSRNQFVLDLTRPEVEEYVFDCIRKVLSSANIEYLKWDMNRQLTDLGSAKLPPERQGEIYHRYVLAVYRLQERLVTEFPNLLLENCSGGGARFDPGMLYYGPQIWTSDDADAIERLTIQEGTALIYPLSTMGAHVADCPNHTVGRTTPFETRGHVALAGTFGYELDITRIPEEDRKQIPDQVAMYHKYNRLVRNGDYYRIASYRENHEFDCYEVVSKDRTEALITYVEVLRRPNFKSRRLRIPGLDPMKTYQIEGKSLTLKGDTIMNAGIPIERTWGDFKSLLIHLVAVE